MTQITVGVAKDLVKLGACLAGIAGRMGFVLLVVSMVQCNRCSAL